MMKAEPRGWRQKHLNDGTDDASEYRLLLRLDVDRMNARVHICWLLLTIRPGLL